MPKDTPTDIIEIVDENLRGGFAQMPRAVLRAKCISPKAKVIYMCLLDYAWQAGSCFPGQDTMASDLGVSIDTVQRAIAELKQYRFIDCKRRGLNRTNIYYILKLSDNPHLTELRPQKRAGYRKLRYPETATLRYPETANSGTNNTQGNNTQGEKDSVSISKGSDTDLHNATQSEIDPDARPVVEPARVGELLAKVQGRFQISTRGRPPKATAAITLYMTELSNIHLHDEQHTKSNITHAMRLMKASGLAESQFVALMLEAKAITLDWAANIKKDDGQQGIKNRAPYYFAILMDLLGMKADQTDTPGIAKAESNNRGVTPVASQFNWDEMIDSPEESADNPAKSSSTSETDLLWQKVLVELAAQMTPANFSTWLRETRLINLEGGKAIIQSPTKFQSENLSMRFTALVNRTFTSVYGEKTSTTFIASEGIAECQSMST